MSGGGSIAAMITTKKNNKRTRKSALKRLKENGSKSTKTELHFENKATKYQLKTIRDKIKKENTIRFRKKAIVIVSLILIIINIVGFVKL